MEYQNRFKATMEIDDCADRILAPLRRSTLKNLRLSCQQMDRLVASNRSNLFSRVYVSAYRKDIDVLIAISSHPRLANAVQELIWDVSRRPDLYEPRSQPRGSEASQSLEKCNQIIKDCCIMLETAGDFQALLKALPQLPCLRTVIFTELMSYYVTQFHSNYFQCGWKEFTTEISPFISYTSPAMREWRALGADMGTPSRREMLAVDESVFEGDDRGMMLRLESWTKALMVGVVTEPPDDIKQRVHCSLLRPTLAITALQISGIELESFIVDVPSWSFRFKTASHRFQGFDLRWFKQSCPLSAGFADMFQSLRYLRLHLDDSQHAGALDMRPVLECAVELERLELSTNGANILIDTAFVLPTCRVLKHLTLHKFSVNIQGLEGVLVPWGLANSLHTIRLADCIFRRPPAISEIELFRWLLDKDVSDAEKRNENTPSNVTKPMAVGPVDEMSESESNNSGTEDFEKFMDFDWKSDSENEMDYFPCTDAMWSRHLDAPFPVADEAFAEDMAMIYWDHYHSEGDSEFEEGSDTPSIRNEIPMARLEPNEARMIPSANHESIELACSGWSWGCKDGRLKLFIDNFLTEEEIGGQDCT